MILNTALHMIRTHYGNRTAERSEVPLINHIEEGLLILQKLQAELPVKCAWCLHPMAQADEDLMKHIDMFGSTVDDARTALHLIEYRHQANNWLSDRVRLVDGEIRLNGLPSPGPLVGVRQMLVADKIQNYKDFVVHHSRTHPRATELHVYFKRWIEALDPPQWALNIVTTAEVKS